MIWVCIIINFFKLFEERMGFRYFGVFNAESLQLDEVIFRVDILWFDELSDENAD